MATLIEQLIEKAKGAPKRVALPECEAQNTLLAARRILDEGVGTPVLVSPKDVIEATAADAGVSLEGMEIVDSSQEEAADALAERYMATGTMRLISAKSARRKIKNPMYYAMMMEELGDVDCTFCGHVNTTGDVLLAASTIIGMAEGVDVPSILALVDTPGFEGPEGSVICFTDCGLNPEPSAEELASIAIAAADGAASLMGWESRVAFLSFSTTGSGTGQSVERIEQALEVVKSRRPDIKADGEFQLDAAIDPKVAAKKVTRESEVAGKANVLVFPDLNAANIAVKLIQRFAKGQAFGHNLSGFKCPVADSSRGATVEEIVGDIAMLVLCAS